MTDCCGSTIQYPQNMEAISSFSQLALGFSFFTSREMEDIDDLIPPNRISDLRIVKKARDSLEIQLEWSAPGGDQDYGTGGNMLYWFC